MSYSVKSYMEKEVSKINSEDTVLEAAKTMAETDSGYQGYLIVLKDGSPVGIVTERDFVIKVLAKGVNASNTKVSTIMSEPLVVIDPDEDMLKASELMKEHSIRKLPVVRDGIIYGIITADGIAQKCGLYIDKTVRDIIRWSAPLGM